ncbi:hypothetical protein FACS1894178_1830 [Bacteroidia bacterium]|nr:hypothetical protein FACS1894178_1830 [Bacteroidia bacterium]
MKTVKILFVALFATLLLAGCEKDENGNYVTYYKNKTVTGYVYSNDTYVHYPDSLYPRTNLLIKIEASVEGVPKHTDYCRTDKNGRFTFKFVKAINARSPSVWKIGEGGDDATPHILIYPSYIDKIDNQFTVDTLFLWGYAYDFQVYQ